jgi:hypothetical protein
MRAIDLLVGPQWLDRLVPGSTTLAKDAQAAGLVPW